MRKLAILGGTFDPVHYGHLLMAEAAVCQLNLEQVIWVPARNPPHKSQFSPLDFDYRVEMVRRAIADHPGFTLHLGDDLAGPSYGISTLEALKTIYPQAEWHWIMGSDAFQTVPKWYCSRELVRQCNWLVAPRPESVPIEFPSLAGSNHWQQFLDAQVDRHCQQVAQQMLQQSISLRWQRLQMPWVSISSSLVRQYCRDRRSIRYLVPEAVRLYIEAQSLYSNNFNS